MAEPDLNINDYSMPSRIFFFHHLPEQSSTIHSSSTPVDHGYENHHTPMTPHLETKSLRISSNSNIHSSSPRLWTMDTGKNHHTTTFKHLPTRDQETEQSSTSNIHSSSTPVDHGYGKESSYSYDSTSTTKTLFPKRSVVHI
jgi:hypothetical protein